MNFILLQLDEQIDKIEIKRMHETTLKGEETMVEVENTPDGKSRPESKANLFLNSAGIDQIIETRSIEEETGRR